MVGQFSMPIDNLRLVKRKEPNPDTISTRNPGDIVGRVIRESSVVVIELFFGEADRRAKIVQRTQEVRNFIDLQSFILPEGEFDTLWQSIILMLEQQKDVDGLWTDSRAEIPEFYFDRDDGEAESVTE